MVGRCARTWDERTVSFVTSSQLARSAKRLSLLWTELRPRLEYSWWDCLLRKRTRDPQRMDVKNRREDRALRLLAYFVFRREHG
jgi:hypothetical protein